MLVVAGLRVCVYVCLENFFYFCFCVFSCMYPLLLRLQLLQLLLLPMFGVDFDAAECVIVGIDDVFDVVAITDVDF